MSDMKAFSDLEQSKKLAEILPLESADMCYQARYDNKNNLKYIPRFVSTIIPLKADIPCWSLAALINIIPQELFDGEYIINITEGIDNKWIITYDHYENRNHSFYGLSAGADNLVDTCTNIIIKLKERNII